VELPSGLCALASVSREVLVTVDGAATQSSLLDELEAKYPVLRGTIRDHATKRRRPFIRFFACQQDFSHAAKEDPLPEAVVEGREPFLIVGAIVGG
jgi:hypothetical protein